jgi:flagellar protein FliO/FliZ
MSRFWRSLGLLLLLAAPCLADSAPSTAPTDGNAVLYPQSDAAHASSAPAMGWSGGTVTFLVLALGAAGGWLLWQRARGGAAGSFGGNSGSGASLHVSETRSLGNRQFLVVANYADRKFLLGVCPGRIDLLAPLDGAGTSAPAADRK